MNNRFSTIVKAAPVRADLATLPTTGWHEHAECVVNMDGDSLPEEGNIVLPFDEATCSTCETPVGPVLTVDSEGLYDVASWVICGRHDEAPGVFLCEDCWDSIATD